MTRVSPSHRLLVALLAAAAAWPLAQAAQAGPDAPDVPSAIRVPEGHKLFLKAHAVGVQIYRCDITSTGPRWGLVAPRANLYNDAGMLVATHFGGPTWQARDGSSVRGSVIEPRVTVDPTAIPWLKLSAVDPTAGTDGSRLAHTTYIQRINTAGGLAPAAGCTLDTAGTIEEVSYTADYTFWKAAAS